MSTYKVREVLDCLCEVIRDGYPFVDISEIAADDELPASLCIDAIASQYEVINYDDIDSCDLPDDDEPFTETFSAQDQCHEITFTYGEITTIYHAIMNALEYFKECEASPDYSRDIKSNIKSASVNCRNLQAKLIKIVNQFHPK